MRLLLDAVLERLKDVRLHVVRVELRLALLVLLEHRAHVFGDLLLLGLHLVHHGVVVLFLRVVFLLNLGHSLAKSPELLDAWRQFRFLLLDFLLDALDDCGQFLQRLTLVVVELLLQFRHALNLVFDRGVASDALLFLELAEELVNVASTTLEYLAGALEDLDFSLEFFKRLLALLMLLVLLSEVRRVLPKVVTLQILGSFQLLVLVFALSQRLFKCDFLALQPLELILLLLLFLLDCLRLTTVDSQFVIARLRLNLAFKNLALSLQPVLVRGQPLKLSLGGLRLVEDHLDTLVPLLFVVELSREHVVEVFTVLARLIAEVVQHLLRAQVLASNLLGVHEALPNGEQLMFAHFDHLGQLAFFFVQTSVLLLLLSQLRGGVEQLLEVCRVSPILEHVDLRQ